MFTYKSISGAPVNIGQYVIPNGTTGLAVKANIPELDEYVGVSISRTSDGTATTVQEFVLEESSIPVIIAPAGTIATAGTVTLGTALQHVYRQAWVYFPASAVVGGAAGLYYTIFSSTTVGVVYTNFVDAATTAFTPSIPTILGDVVVGSNSAYTQTVTSDLALVNITVPAGMLGSSGTLSLEALFSLFSSGNAKTIKASFGNMVALNTAPTASLSLSVSKSVRNHAADVQVSSAAAAIGHGAAGVLIKGAVDTTADVSFIITGQTHTTDSGTSHIVLEAFSVSVSAK